MSQETQVQTILACSQCGRAFAQSDLVHIAGSWVCADCKPAFLSRVMASGAASPLGWRYGGFWVRLGARMIDGFIFLIPFVVLAILFMPSLIRRGPAAAPNPLLAFGFLTFFAVGFVAGGFYEVLMLKYKSGTLGKLACGLKVIRADGSSLSWGTCVGRFFMWNVVTSGIPYINSIFMLVTSIMIATDNEKRALHDRVCDTRVIHK
jgi:uncharacterized RDD family membrane protein YckC